MTAPLIKCVGTINPATFMYTNCNILFKEYGKRERKSKFV